MTCLGLQVSTKVDTVSFLHKISYLLSLFLQSTCKWTHVICAGNIATNDLHRMVFMKYQANCLC